MVMRCPRCGTTLEEYRKKGLVGCARCYAAFGREVLSDVLRVQGDGVHRGKRLPEGNHRLLAEAVREVSAQKDEALRRGKYAEAAKAALKEEELKLALFGGEE